MPQLPTSGSRGNEMANSCQVNTEVSERYPRASLVLATEVINIVTTYSASKVYSLEV